MIAFAVRICLIALLAIQSLLVSSANADKIPTVGVVLGSNASTAKPYEQALRLGLRAHGYTDGENIDVMVRYANGDLTQLPRLLGELIAQQVDVLVVTPSAARAAMQATSSIPIVSPTMDDPVERGLAKSFSRPTGNLTGLSAQGTETDAKRLELAKELVPGLKRLGLLFDPTDPTAVVDAKSFRTVTERLQVLLRTYPVRNIEEIQQALRRIDRERPQALMVWNSPLILVHRKLIMEFTSRRLPVITEGRDLAEAGALLTYSANFVEIWERSASYVDRILKGEKPADLPIEQPTSFELLVNQRTAQALGLSVPESILLRADEILR
jgi:putative tryptophan/tyrosine transport system substrate-binding protein